MQRVGPGSAPQPVAVLAGLLRLLSYLDGAQYDQGPLVYPSNATENSE